MKFQELTYLVLEDKGDARGGNFTPPQEWFSLLYKVKHVHLTTLHPGHVRGNHYHVDRSELIIVFHADSWSLHWDSGPDTTAAHRVFKGSGATIIAVPPFFSHAIRNDGGMDLQLVALSDGEYSAANPDTYPRPVTDVELPSETFP